MDRSAKTRKVKKGALFRRVIPALLTASIVLFLAVFFAFVPFRLLLPAYKISARGEGELRLHFLGLEGGVTAVEFPDGEVLVVNAGSGSFDGDNALARYLRALDMTSLSLLFTDADTSHVGGAAALFEVFGVEKVYLPAFSSDAGAYRRFLSAMEKENCAREKLVRYGTIVNESGAYAVCLSPYSTEEEDATEEDASAVMYLSYAGVNVLLTGDVTRKREKRLAEEYGTLNTVFDRGEYKVRLDETDILLAPKHGANSGSSKEWLSLLRPQTTVILCNQNEVPSGAAIERIAESSGEVLRTDELGAVMITLKEGGYRTTAHIV